MPITSTDSRTKGSAILSTTPNATASAMVPKVCAIASSERMSLSSVSGASSAGVRMLRAAALPVPARERASVAARPAGACRRGILPRPRGG
jgi:hypothetical protein